MIPSKTSAAIVAVAFTDRSLAVLNLHDERAGSVILCAEKMQIHIPPGHQLIIGQASDPDARKLQPVVRLPLRSERKLAAVNDIHMYQSEFSYTACMNKLQPLHRLGSSTEPGDKRTIKKLQKTAAALHIMTVGRGGFR